MSETQSNIMELRGWSMILRNIIKSDRFKNQINYQGYYLSPEYANFRPWP